MKQYSPNRRKRLYCCLTVIAFLCCALAFILDFFTSTPFSSLFSKIACALTLLALVSVFPIIREYHAALELLSNGRSQPAASLRGQIEHNEREYERALTQKQSTLIALQSQINPHFLYNTLDSIRGQALMHNIPEIADMTESLSSIFRYSISRQSTMVPLRDELRNIQIYFSIQQYRFQNRFSMDVSCEDPSALDCYLPKLTLQPLVENCIFHGLELLDRPGHIYVDITLTSNRLLICVSDDGCGIPEEKLSRLFTGMLDSEAPTDQSRSSMGIGLSVCSAIIKAHGGEIWANKRAGGGTEVGFRLEMEDENGE